MYLSGTEYNFEERFHQLPISTGELQQFLDEKAIYTGVVASTSGKWEREETRKRIIFDYGI